MFASAGSFLRLRSAVGSVELACTQVVSRRVFDGALERASHVEGSVIFYTMVVMMKDPKFCVVVI